MSYQLVADSPRRLTSNPLRILDSKNAKTQALLADAPQLDDYLDDDSRQHFEALEQMLDTANIVYSVGSTLPLGFFFIKFNSVSSAEDSLEFIKHTYLFCSLTVRISISKQAFYTI